MDLLSKTVDPITHIQKLAEIPKLVIVGADDEFMMPDWTKIYYDNLKGELNFLVVPNGEHSLVQGMHEVITSISSFVRSIAAK